MKRILLIVAFSCFAVSAFADVKGYVRNYDYQNGNVRLWVQYYYDDKIITTSKEGDYDYPYLQMSEVYGKTNAEIKEYIEKMIKARCEYYIYSNRLGLTEEKSLQRIEDEKNNLELKQQLDVIGAQINKISVSVNSVVDNIDTNSDGIPDTAVTIYSDGTTEEKPL